MSCVKCGSPYIVNVKYQLCDDCNYIRLHGVDKVTAALEKERLKPQVKKRKKHFKKIEKVDKRAIVLQKDRETYFEVFMDKPHYCEECGHPLPEEFLDENGNINCIGQYSHILSKKAYPEFRHNKKNFNRLCPVPCHDRWEFGDREKMNIYRSNQQIIQELRDGKALNSGNR